MSYTKFNIPLKYGVIALPLMTSQNQGKLFDNTLNFEAFVKAIRVCSVTDIQYSYRGYGTLEAATFSCVDSMKKMLYVLKEYGELINVNSLIKCGYNKLDLKMQYLIKNQGLLMEVICTAPEQIYLNIGTFLHVVLAGEDFPCLKEVFKLIGKKIEFNLQDFEGKTLLILAAKIRSIEAVIEILNLISTKADKGTLVNMSDTDGRTALHYAVAYGHLDMVKLLLDSGANPSLKDKTGRNTLAYASISRDEIHEMFYSIEIDSARDEKAIRNSLSNSFFYYCNRIDREGTIDGLSSDVLASKSNVLGSMKNRVGNL